MNASTSPAFSRITPGTAAAPAPRPPLRLTSRRGLRGVRSMGLVRNALVVAVLSVLGSTGSGCGDPVPDDGYTPPAGVGGITQTPVVGDIVCDQTRRDLQGSVDDAISDTQREVDRMIAENPELAPYAADAKRTLADSEPQVRANLDDALAANGC